MAALVAGIRQSRVSMAKTYVPPTTAELTERLVDLRHEIAMFQYCAVSIARLPAELKSHAAGAIHLEAFLMHFRNLRDFLAPNTWPPERLQVDGLFARHYAAAWTATYDTFWKDRESVPNERKVINKQLSHLSRERQQPSPMWLVGLMHERIREAFDSFCIVVDPKWAPQLQQVRWAPLDHAVGAGGVTLRVLEATPS